MLSEGDLFADLPEEIRAGFRPDLEPQVVEEAALPHLWELRQAWNRRAPEAIGLPTETYRELIERRKRYAELVGKIKRGEIIQISDFITYNLNIRQFAQDVIEQIQDAKFVAYFYKAIRGITILDPTCGSGAFLFAALNILEPLYEACLTRMEQWEAEAPGQHSFFTETLDEIKNGQHPNRQYYIYKSIILNNLYGVDLMKEAVEIAKLRLFLKLVATVDLSPRKENFGLEPLPDIDFNIRAGNTLVGFATEPELLETIQKKEALFAQEKLDEFKEDCWVVCQAYAHFQDAQRTNDQGSDSFKQSKNDLRERLEKLNNKLNVYLATNYGIDAERKPKKYQAWHDSHQPFHWFAEFYRIVAEQGGFDVIIGNPPYVELKKVEYEAKKFRTSSCGNLYACVVERVSKLERSASKTGMIIPHSSICTDRMSPLLNIITGYSSWLSSFDIRPSKLFDGVDQRLLIYITSANEEAIHTSKYHRWDSTSRESLFDLIEYVSNGPNPIPNSVLKANKSLEVEILEKILTDKVLSLFERSSSKMLFFHNAPRYFIRAMDSIPYFWNEKDGEKVSTQLKAISYGNIENNSIAACLLNSSLFYWWFILYSDSRHLNRREIEHFPLSIAEVEMRLKRKAIELHSLLMDNYDRNSVRKTAFYKATGKVVYDEYRPKKSKPIIDQIDTVLAQHYGFTEEELDFIINYDIKYRMGKALLGEDGHADEDE